ncbi:cellular retinaldehyde-binding triple function, C-terminal [Musa troglodytarum]|uniref:Cellular retinaldehyde-binding triple function, C-terminal n=1 Tax=Musa troglodytarum TaxID=320322 RepID=A0A9E7EX15_9LILI|nr:cellular retinaldehyde-binding triple function, C-terminal [Musa troglodytarum]
MAENAGEEFSVVVLASDLGVDARSSSHRRSARRQRTTMRTWCGTIATPTSSPTRISPISRSFGPFASRDSIKPATVSSGSSGSTSCGERLKRYVFHKFFTELQEGPFCILYTHSTVQSEENNPGMSIMRWIYEELPSGYKERLQIVYFLHPGLRSRLVLATFGRFFLSGRLYWKIKYVSRLQYLWDDIKKGEVEIPEFVHKHDDLLEHRPLTDYGIEPDPFHLTEVPAMEYSLGSETYLKDGEGKIVAIGCNTRTIPVALLEVDLKGPH